MTLNEKKLQLINYMIMKIEEEDWHAIADVAMDLREIEVRIKILGDYKSATIPFNERK